MSKRKRKKQPRRAATGRKRSGLPPGVKLISYEVTWEPLKDTPHDFTPPELEDDMERLYHLSQDEPRKAIGVLEDLIARYPEVAKLRNYLCVAYGGVGESDKAKETARENYRHHPDYLFARLNIAEFCIGDGELDEIPKIFNNKYELSQLYPERKLFHATEVIQFAGVIGYYFVRRGELEVARVYYKMLQDLDPEHPITRRLERCLERGILGQLMDRLHSRRRSH